MNEWLTVADGVRRRIRLDGEKMMMVEVEFAKGAVGSLHSHPHEQLTYVTKGRMRFTLAGKAVDVPSGETIRMPPDMPHEALALEPSALIDIFSPPREDFRAK